MKNEKFDSKQRSPFSEEEELFVLRNKDGKIVGIKDLRQANFQETMKDWKKYLPKMSLPKIIIWCSCLVIDCNC